MNSEQDKGIKEWLSWEERWAVIHLDDIYLVSCTHPYRSGCILTEENDGELSTQWGVFCGDCPHAERIKISEETWKIMKKLDNEKELDDEQMTNEYDKDWFEKGGCL